MTTSSGRRIPLAPPEGWLTLGLVILLGLSLAWSLDDARLVLGRDALTDFLVWTAVGGALAGFVGPMVRWGRWRTYLIGAAFAALVTPLIVGTVLLDGADGTLQALFTATADASANAVRDLIVMNRRTTSEFGHHLLVLGLIVWGSAMFASFAVFGHRRPLNAVLLVGFLLVGNMSLTTSDQLVYLVLYSLASLFLLIRLHTLEEQGEWLRRRIGDPSAIAGLYLRGGTVFITVAVLGALLLTNVAQSAPLAGAWTDVGSRAIEWSRAISRFLPQSGTGPVLGPSFGSSATIGSRWVTDRNVALTVEIPAGLVAYKPYWRAATYDVLTLDGFEFDEPTTILDRAAGAPLLEGTGDAVTLDGRQEVTFRITPTSGGLIYAPQAPVAIDVATDLEVVGDAGYFAAMQRDGGDGAYTVTSYVPVLGDTVAAALTQEKLRVAGTAYPEEIVARYAQPTTEAILGPEARIVLADILQARPTNAYDLAAAMVAYLQSPDNFTYDIDITDDGIDCDQLSRIECFAVHRRGFCQWYAAMMTAFLREQGVPARVVQGFLPGERSVSSGTETVRNDRAHAWVEAYFPVYGWVEFDPTGIGALPPIPQGQAQPSGSPGASAIASARPRPSESAPRDNEPGGAGGTIDRGGAVGPLIAVTFLLAVIMAAVAAVAWRRGPRGPVTADSAYGSVTRLASRFGFGPRPNQTVYEYAGALADLLPSARPELETVAQAKVEVAYGGRRLGGETLSGLREAQRRLRMSLLRLAIRRTRRGRPRR
ncbi:MAG: transglutaminase TgpA family protein [Candidatus Limnocylindrales bacterium]